MNGVVIKVPLDAHIDINIHMCICACMYTNIHMCICACMYAYVHIYLCIEYGCISIYIYIIGYGT